MGRARTPSAMFLALAGSPLVVLALIGWTRLGLARSPDPRSAPQPVLEARSVAAAALAAFWSRTVPQGPAEVDLPALRQRLSAAGLRDGGELELEHGVPMPEGAGRILARRADLPEAVALELWEAAPSDLGGRTQQRLGAWTVERRDWEGTGATLVARDLSCTLCHVDVTPAPGANRPVRVVALADVALRSDARVAIHGTLHLGGALRDGGGLEVAPQHVESLVFPPLMAGLVLPRPSAPLAPLTALDGLRLRAREGRLLGRWSGAPCVRERPLPRGFPSFDDVSPARPDGAGLAGGRGGVVALGEALGDSDAGGPLAPARHSCGHLWAVGTEAAPLTLEGDVLVEGDLVLAGVLRGRGVLRARGSIVVAGSLRVDGHVALVAGRDVLVGAISSGDEVSPFVAAAAPHAAHGLAWLAPARLRRMGDRGEATVTLDAFVFAPGHVVVVAGKGLGGGDVHVRGGLAADVVAVHAPGRFTLEDDPHARAEVRLRAPRGVTLVRSGHTLASSAEVSTVSARGDRRAVPIDSLSPTSRSARPTPVPR